MPLSIRPKQEDDLNKLVKQGVEVSVDPQVIIDWVVNNFDAEDIYGEQHLAEWADRAGYVMGTDTDEEEQRVRY
jgi:dissimilatory sulfite reductase (desulfoviridin) alpha/beta subunit